MGVFFISKNRAVDHEWILPSTKTGRQLVDGLKQRSAQNSNESARKNEQIFHNPDVQSWKRTNPNRLVAVIKAKGCSIKH